MKHMQEVINDSKLYILVCVLCLYMFVYISTGLWTLWSMCCDYRIISGVHSQLSSHLEKIILVLATASIRLVIPWTSREFYVSVSKLIIGALDFHVPTITSGFV